MPLWSLVNPPVHTSLLEETEDKNVSIRSWFNVKFCAMPPPNHWAVLKTNNNSTCQKYKIWTKDKCGQWEWDPDHLSSSPCKPHPKRWRCSATCREGNRFTCLQVPQVLRWALWEMSRKDATHWTGNTSCLCIMEDDYPNTLLCLPHHANKNPKIQECLFEKHSQRPEHRTGMFNVCRGLRSLEKMMCHEVWDLSCWPDIWVVIG